MHTQAAFAGYPSFIIEGYHVKLRQKRTERCKTDNNKYLIQKSRLNSLVWGSLTLAQLDL